MSDAPRIRRCSPARGRPVAPASLVAVAIMLGIPLHAEPAPGMFAVVYAGILVRPPPGGNTSGPFVFRALDLDGGTALDRTTPDMDLSLSLAAIPLTFRGSVPSTGALADAGGSLVSLQQCQALLAGPTASKLSAAEKSPTNYYCVRTAQGRVGIYRVRQVAVQYMPDSFANVTAIIEYLVWGAPVRDGEMGPIVKGLNFDQGDLYSRRVTTDEECAAVCSGDNRCLAVTFVYPQQNCWVKDRVDRIGFSDDMASALKKGRSQ